MLEHFFLLGPLPDNRIAGSYDLGLVTLSYVIATLASYVALDMASQLGREQSPRIARFWHIGGAIAMGAGIWSMHFTGMLAYKMNMEHSYKVGITLLSLLLPIVFSYIVLGIVKKPTLDNRTLWKAAPFLGLGIVCMHYTGMAAMDMKASLHYTPSWFAISVLIAMIASAAALRLAFTASQSKPGSRMPFKLLAAAVMGAAICGMHYAGMAASVIVPFADCRIDPAFNSMNTMLAIGIGIVTLIVLGIAIVALTLNQKITEHLKEQIAKRTEELEKANEQLLHAKELAEAANIAKSEFLANMSHEIRTPMNAVIGITQILHANKLPAERRDEYLDTLQLSAASLLNLINEVLDISKIETNAIELEHSAFDLKELIGEVLALMSIRAAEKGLRLKFEYSPLLATRFMGDALRIRQILVNLLSNAVKFTDQGGVTVEVSGQKSSAAHITDVTVQVIDTGIGIAGDKQKIIFEKFVQADSTTTRRYGGSGLGLSICKGLVDKMGGRIDVASLPGKGSQFTVRLPLTKCAANDVLPPPPKTQPELPPRHNLHGKVSGLLVEDNPANILVATTYLKSLDYDYDIARNGREAVEKFSMRPYGFVLMDIQLPDMDGYEATRFIREFEQIHGLAPTPIIAMTAFAYNEDKERCFQAGMNGYLAKPIMPEQLQEKLQEVLAQAA